MEPIRRSVIFSSPWSAVRSKAEILIQILSFVL